jgi:hypothetical protein
VSCKKSRSATLWRHCKEWANSPRACCPLRAEEAVGLWVGAVGGMSAASANKETPQKCSITLDVPVQERKSRQPRSSERECGSAGMLKSEIERGEPKAPCRAAVESRKISKWFRFQGCTRRLLCGARGGSGAAIKTPAPRPGISGTSASGDPDTDIHQQAASRVLYRCRSITHCTVYSDTRRKGIVYGATIDQKALFSARNHRSPYLQVSAKMS